MDAEKQEESLKKLAELRDVQLVFTAHGGYSNNFDSVMAEWM
jgi:hypothetical protein